MPNFVGEQKIRKFPSLNYMSENFAYLCDNATKVCCTSIVVHNYANDKRMAKFVKATKKAPLPQRVEVLSYILSYKVGI